MAKSVCQRDIQFEGSAVVRFELAGRERRHCFHIWSQCPFDIILGTDFMQICGPVSIDHKQKNFWFSKCADFAKLARIEPNARENKSHEAHDLSGDTDIISKNSRQGQQRRRKLDYSVPSKPTSRAQALLVRSKVGKETDTMQAGQKAHDKPNMETAKAQNSM